MSNKIINKIIGAVVLLMLVGIAYGVSISCPECYVGDCRCISDCPYGAGSVDIFKTKCAGSPDFSYTLSSGEMQWSPPEKTTYYMRVLCDEGGKSSCIAVKVGSAPTTTTIKKPKPPKPTPRTTTTTSSTSTTVTSTTSSSTTTTMNTTTSTTTTISTSTTSVRPTTTTTILVCNNNTICESDRTENYINCPQDCLSGGQDNYCDGVEEGICDPDCGRMEDPDCICNNNITCEIGIENHLNCPLDCPAGGQDNYCDGLEDGICDLDCAVEDDPDCGEKDVFQYLDYLIYIVPLIIICAIAVVAYKMMEKKKHAKKNKEKEDMIGWVGEELSNGEDPEMLKKILEEEGYDPGIVDETMKRL